MTARADRLRIRVTEDELSRWKGAAASHGLPVSTWMRSIADEAAATGQNGRAVAAELAQLRSDIARGIGNNLNQIAHRINGGGTTSGEILDEAARAIREAQRDIERALRAVRPPKAKRAA